MGRTYIVHGIEDIIEDVKAQNMQEALAKFEDRYPECALISVNDHDVISICESCDRYMLDDEEDYGSDCSICKKCAKELKGKRGSE